MKSTKPSKPGVPKFACGDGVAATRVVGGRALRSSAARRPESALAAVVDHQNTRQHAQRHERHRVDACASHVSSSAVAASASIGSEPTSRRHRGVAATCRRNCSVLARGVTSASDRLRSAALWRRCSDPSPRWTPPPTLGALYALEQLRPGNTVPRRLLGGPRRDVSPRMAWPPRRRDEAVRRRKDAYNRCSHGVAELVCRAWRAEG